MILLNTVIPVLNVDLEKDRATQFFRNIEDSVVKDYVDYWASVAPKDVDDIFRRYLFAFMSVHTTWKGNCSGYNAIKDFSEWIEDKEILLQKLATSGVGLHNNRTNYVWDFSQKFWAAPTDFYFTTKRNHIKKRDNIVKQVTGIGFAKVSFALEMIHPVECRALCLDVHMLRLFGMEDLKYNSVSGIKKYKDAEQHWSVSCGKKKVPSYIARSIYWDSLQGKKDSRYWSVVLES